MCILHVLALYIKIPRSPCVCLENLNLYFTYAWEIAFVATVHGGRMSAHETQTMFVCVGSGHGLQ